MNYLKKLVSGLCLGMFSLICTSNAFAISRYEIKLDYYNHYVQLRPSGEGIGFCLIRNKENKGSNVVFAIDLVQNSTVPSKMDVNLLYEPCSKLLSKCRNKIFRKDINREEYFHFLKICQTITGHKSSYSEKNQGMQCLISQLYNFFDIT